MSVRLTLTAQAGRQVEDTCPVSRMLAGTEITLEVRLGGS
jgi:hypothetical protein